MLARYEKPRYSSLRKSYCWRKTDFRLSAGPCNADGLLVWNSVHESERFDDDVSRTRKRWHCRFSFWCSDTTPCFAVTWAFESSKNCNKKKTRTCLIIATFAVLLLSSTCSTIAEDWKTSESLSCDESCQTKKSVGHDKQQNTWILKTKGFFRSFMHFRAGFPSRVRRVCTYLHGEKVGYIFITNQRIQNEEMAGITQTLHALQS